MELEGLTKSVGAAKRARPGSGLVGPGGGGGGGGSRVRTSVEPKDMWILNEVFSLALQNFMTSMILRHS